MQRRWVVRPDIETGIVDRAELVDAIMDGEAMLWRGGGVLTVLPFRDEPIGAVPGEMVTTGAIIEWKDRTDAKAQPERASGPMPVAAPQPEPVAEPEPVTVVRSASPDGLDEAALPDEDLTEVPAALR